MENEGAWQNSRKNKIERRNYKTKHFEPKELRHKASIIEMVICSSTYEDDQMTGFDDNLEKTL